MNRAQLFFSHQIESAGGPARYKSNSKVQCGSISRAASAALAFVLLLSIVATPWAHAQTNEVADPFHRKPTYEVLHRFHGRDGNAPVAGVIRDREGNLYGTTVLGGDLNCPNAPAGCGVVFRLDRTGKGTVLHTFTSGADGAFPEASMIRDRAGNLYGTTPGGGVSNCNNSGQGCGVVFKMDRDGEETVLHRFTGGADGAGPQAGLVRDEADNLYGTTFFGGASSFGVVFKLNPYTHKLTVLHSFTLGTDGGGPQAGLIRDEAGNMYGTCQAGGTYGYGVLFKLDPTTREVTALYAFTGGADGAFPSAGLLRDEAGNLYGTTVNGGDPSCPPYGCGVVFKLDKDGEETVLHTFTAGGDGAFPSAGLIQDKAGNLYGTAPEGGDLNCFRPTGCGVVFKLDKDGEETVLHSFTGGRKGAAPYAGLTQDEEGNLYGAAILGGDLDDLDCSPDGCGVVFKLTPSHKDDQ
jgi:uncharacterized repeat protein (TIGR03803 family)